MDVRQGLVAEGAGHGDLLARGQVARAGIRPSLIALRITTSSRGLAQARRRRTSSLLRDNAWPRSRPTAHALQRHELDFISVAASFHEKWVCASTMPGMSVARPHRSRWHPLQAGSSPRVMRWIRLPCTSTFAGERLGATAVDDADVGEQYAAHVASCARSTRGFQEKRLYPLAEANQTSPRLDESEPRC